VTDEQLNAIQRLSVTVRQPIETHGAEGGNVRVICLGDDREYFIRPNGSIEKVRATPRDGPDDTRRASRQRAPSPTSAPQI
jgi:hypothetical protein